MGVGKQLDLKERRREKKRKGKSKGRREELPEKSSAQTEVT